MATAEAAPAIRTTELRKEYGSTVAVDDVSLEVPAGDIFALLGPNGAGKTTLVEMLQGLRTPTSGTATVLGVALDADRGAITERIGVVPQSFHTFERLTVRENVALVGDLHETALPVEDVLAELDLLDWAEEPFHALSGGYQRRTGIAMALVNDPDLLFLDEPTTGLDPAARRSTWELIDQLPARETTVVLTTHYMDEVEYLADRVGLLLDGRLEAVGDVDSLVDRYAGEVKIVVHPAPDRGGREQVAATLERMAAAVHRPESGELIGVFADRQVAQDAYGALQELGTGRSIDLVSADMADVFLELAGDTLGPSGELE